MHDGQEVSGDYGSLAEVTVAKKSVEWVELMINCYTFRYIELFQSFDVPPGIRRVRFRKIGGE